MAHSLFFTRTHTPSIFRSESFIQNKMMSIKFNTVVKCEYGSLIIFLLITAFDQIRFFIERLKNQGSAIRTIPP